MTEIEVSESDALELQAKVRDALLEIFEQMHGRLPDEARATWGGGDRLRPPRPTNGAFVSPHIDAVIAAVMARLRPA